MTFQSISSADWKKENLKSTLKQIKKKKILVVGDIGVDRYTEGSVERISPEAPVPIVNVESERLKLGLAANVADNILALGGTPFLTSVMGDDRAADDFKDLLNKSKITSQCMVVEKKRRTALKERILSEKQQLLRVDYEDVFPVSSATEKKILQKAKSLIKTMDAVILEDYCKGLLVPKVIKGIIEIAKNAGKPVLVDPNMKSDIHAFKGATVLTPNRKEAEILSGVPKISDKKTILKAGRKLLELTAAKYIIITLGKDGMAVFAQNGTEKTLLIPTFAKEVYDVSGAGDTVIAVLALALSSGADVEEAAILGNIAAGIEVGKRGTATVSPREISDALEEI